MLAAYWNTYTERLVAPIRAEALAAFGKSNTTAPSTSLPPDAESLTPPGRCAEAKRVMRFVTRPEPSEVHHDVIYDPAEEYLPKRLEFVPFEWRHAVRAPLPRSTGHWIGEWLRSLVGNVPASQPDARIGATTGPWLNQWWQGDWYFYVNALEHQVIWRELFFDLVFVVLISQAGHRLHENVSALSLSNLVIVLYPIWAMWLSTSQIVNLFCLSENLAKLLQFVMVILAVQMADYTLNCLGEDDANTSVSFIAIFLVSRVITTLVHLVTGYLVVPLRRTLWYRALLLVVCGIPWIVSIWFRGNNHVMSICWWIATLLDGVFFYLFQGLLFARDEIRLAWNVNHWVERLHLFVLVTFGEFVASAVFPVRASSFSWEVFLTSLVVILMVMGLAWTYFSNEQSCVLLHAMRAGQVWGMLWTVLHFYFVVCIVAASASTSQIVSLSTGLSQEPEAPEGAAKRETSSEALPIYINMFAGTICGGLVLCSLFGLMHITVFEMGAEVLQAQDAVIQREAKEGKSVTERTQRYFFPLKYKWIRFAVQLVIAVCTLLSAANFINVTARNVVGWVTSMLIIMLLFEEIWRTMFSVEVNLVEELGEDTRELERKD